MIASRTTSGEIHATGNAAGPRTPGLGGWRRRRRVVVLAFMALATDVANASGAGFTFRWQDNSANESGFRIERSTDGHAFAPIAVVGAGTTRFEDAGLAVGARYWYRVAAFNAGGLSPYSAAVDAMLPAATGNTAPTISTFGDRTVSLGAAITAIPFVIADGETTPENLVLTGNSSNADLVPVGNLRFSGSGVNRTLSVTPLANRTGWTTIWIKVSDGTLTAVNSFVLVVTAADPGAPRACLSNLSTRGVSRPDDPLLAGFVVAGAGKRILLRAVGPTLAASPFRVASALPDPRLRLLRLAGADYAAYASNGDWSELPGGAAIATACTDLRAFALLDASGDAALVLDTPAGQYAAIAEDEARTAGVALVEIYDADPETGGAGRLLNLSTRGFVGVGDEVLICGFVVAGPGHVRLLLRAVGPGIAVSPFNVPGVLANPAIEVFRQDAVGNSVPVFAGDDWGTESDAAGIAGTAATVGAFALPAGSRDAATVLTLGPGAYTAVVRGATGGTGTALAEIYEVP